MTDPSTTFVEINGRATEADPLLFEMLSGEGHFTAMQVREAAYADWGSI